MKKLIVVLVAVTLIFQACDEFFSNVRGEGPVVKETRNVTGFKGVELGASGDVFIKQGTEFKVVVETHKNIAELLETVNDNGILQINFKNNLGSISYDKFKIYIEAPSFETINITGSGNITAENALTGSKLALELGGSGNINIGETTIAKIEASIGGSGSIEVKGTAESSDFTITGSGNIEAKNMKAKNVKAEISGSGSIECYAETEIDASVTGSGGIGYYGTPSVKSRITGSGSIEKR